MRRRSAIAAATAILFVTGCIHEDAPQIYAPPPPPNVVLSGPIEASGGLELVMGDNLFLPDTLIEAHSHPGEEFIFVQAGTVILSIRGEEPLLLGPGDALRIPAGQVHSAQVGAQGARVISNWIKPEDSPLRIPFEE